jgi:hypothetical protein
MINKSLILLLICFLFGCGYEPLYLKKNSLDIPIKSWEFNGDKNINRMISAQLKSLQNNDKKIGYDAKINSTKLLEVVSKDSSGNPSIYRLSVMVNLKLIDDQSIIKQRDFDKSFTFNDNENKFELAQYKKNIEVNLVNEVAEKIFIFVRSD